MAPVALAVLDFLVDWSITTLILAAFVLMLVVLVASFGIAVAWRRWKEGKRHRAAVAKGTLPPPGPTGPTGVGFRASAIVHKLPKLPRPTLPKAALPKVGLPKLKRKD